MALRIFAKIEIRFPARAWEWVDATQRSKVALPNEPSEVRRESSIGILDRVPPVLYRRLMHFP